MKIYYACILAALLVNCSPKKEVQQTSLTISFERVSPSLDAVMSNEVTVSVIAQGYEWSEGPLWLEDKQMLLFSDVPANTIYQWTEKEGTWAGVAQNEWYKENPQLVAELPANLKSQ